MKTFLFLLAAALLTAPLTADDKSSNPTNAAVQAISRGTVTEYIPGTTFVVRESSGPIVYVQGQDVIYTTKTGVILTQDAARALIKVGTPVTVHYDTRGDTRVLTRVVVDED